MKPVLFRSRPVRSVLDVDRTELLVQLKTILGRQGVVAAYLVGSYARGTAQAWSDIDLIVVCDTPLPFPERPRLFAELESLGLPIDLLVYTPDEFARMEESPSSFWRATQKERVRLI